MGVLFVTSFTSLMRGAGSTTGNHFTPSKNPPLICRRKRTLFCWRFPYPESTPCAVISLKTKHCSYSQAGRRGFEPRLPLHLFSNLGTISNCFHSIPLR